MTTIKFLDKYKNLHKIYTPRYRLHISVCFLDTSTTYKSKEDA